MEDVPELTQLPVRSLLEWSPFEYHVWSEFKRPITRAEVSHRIQLGDFEANPYDLSKISWRRKDHIRRVAYLVVNPSGDPIDIDVGVPALGCYVPWPVRNGYHRLGAAIYRMDEFIPINFSGDLGYAVELFGLS